MYILQYNLLYVQSNFTCNPGLTTRTDDFISNLLTFRYKSFTFHLPSLLSDLSVINISGSCGVASLLSVAEMF